MLSDREAWLDRVSHTQKMETFSSSEFQPKKSTIWSTICTCSSHDSLFKIKKDLRSAINKPAIRSPLTKEDPVALHKQKGFLSFGPIT